MKHAGPVFLALIGMLVVAARAPAATVLAPYGNNHGENHSNENHSHESLIYDDISNGNVNGCNFTYADLTGANLHQCSRYNADFSYSILRGANLRDGYGPQAKFVGADLTGADLSGNNNWSVNFGGANLSGAKLGTYLDAAIFAGATLVGTDFGGSDLYDAHFENTNLGGAQFTGAGRLDQAHFGATLYDSSTVFPAGFSPSAHGLTLVPEPSIMALLGAGALGLALAARCRAGRKRTAHGPHDQRETTR
jgi:hypothetical protein